MPTHQPLQDGHGRTISYLRLSVTDRCNLRCSYCVPERFTFIPHQDILRYEEMLDLLALTRDMDVAKIRFTGGEPFVRKGFVSFLTEVRQRFPRLDMRVTTNGSLLEPHIAQLQEAELDCVNLSLDTLRRDRYQRITGRDFFPRVRRALDLLLAAGIRVKVNAVAMAGWNEDELPAFLHLARSMPLDVRFIEQMPVGRACSRTGGFWSAQDILARAGELASLTPVAPSRHNGPARMFAIAGAQGRFGVISALSHHFCAGCNRLRITSSGNLRTCLFSDREYRLRPALRHPDLGPAAVGRIIRLATQHKPVGANLFTTGETSDAPICTSRMSAIGG